MVKFSIHLNRHVFVMCRLLNLPIEYPVTGIFDRVWSNCEQMTLPITVKKGWLGGAKVSFILRHRGVQPILAYSWARPAILVAGKGRGGCFYFFFFFTFIPVSLSFLSLSFISSTISSISFLPFSGRRHKMTHKGWHVVKPQLNQSNHCQKLVMNDSPWQTKSVVHTFLTDVSAILHCWPRRNPLIQIKSSS